MMPDSSRLASLELCQNERHGPERLSSPQTHPTTKADADIIETNRGENLALALYATNETPRNFVSQATNIKQAQRLMARKQYARIIFNIRKKAA